MKKEFIALITLLVFFCCGTFLYAMISRQYWNVENVMEEEVNNDEEEINNDNNQSDTSNELEDEVVGKLKLTVNEKEYTVLLNGSEASKSFVAMLPLTVSFEDYNQTEKIAYLNERIDVSSEPSGYTPEVGDFAYYTPWGNLSIFYKEFRYSNNLVKLGKIESGIEELQNLNEDFQMTIEVME